MDLEEYKNVIRGRFNELSDEEKTVSDAADSPVGDVIRKLFGPETSGLFAQNEQINLHKVCQLKWLKLNHNLWVIKCNVLV